MSMRIIKMAILILLSSEEESQEYVFLYDSKS